MDGTIIIADDDKNLRAILTQSLTRAGAKVRATATLSTLWRWLEEGEGDVVLCDVNLADGDAIDELPKMRKLRPDLQFVLMSAQNTVLTALRAGEAGAFDYLAKPFDLHFMVETLMRAQKRTDKKPISTRESQPENLPLIGRSDVMQDIYRSLSKIMSSDLPVLISGEVGTGKTLIANLIHQYGARKALPLIRFDGSNRQSKSITEIFEEAGEGSLILEKIQDYSASEQKEILQAIESEQYQARLIATASPKLHQAVKDGKFREDLFHQLNILPIHLPTLSERPEDIKELVEFFLFEQSAGQKSLENAAFEIIQSAQWSGNVKELEGFVKRLVAMSNGDILTEAEISPFLGQGNGQYSSNENNNSLSSAVENHIRRFMKLHGQELPPNGFYGELIDQVDGTVINLILEMTGGNQIRAAEVLGINRNTLRKKIKNLDISVTKSKKLM